MFCALVRHDFKVQLFDLCPEIMCIGGQRLSLQCYHEAKLKIFERNWNY